MSALSWWAVLEVEAAGGAPAFVEYVPERAVWLCALTDELAPAEAATAEGAIALAFQSLRRLRGERRCPVCGVVFVGKTAQAVTCSSPCRQRAYRERRDRAATRA